MPRFRSNRSEPDADSPRNASGETADGADTTGAADQTDQTGQTDTADTADKTGEADIMPVDEAAVSRRDGNQLAALLAELRPGANAHVIAKSDVVNGLLDLRLATTANVFIDRIDRALVDIPGKTTAPAEWWREELDLLEVLAGDLVDPPPLAKQP